jgi:hypothetical protein
VKTRRGHWPRVAALVAAILVALGITGLAVANASQLTVTSGKIVLQSAARCTNATIATTGGSAHVGSTFTSVQFSSVAAACAGLAAQVTVYDAAGTAIATGSGTAAAGSFDVATTSFAYSAVAGVAVLFDTWGVPTTWTVPVVPPFVLTDSGYVPLVPTQYCTLNTITTTTGTTGGYPFVNVTFRVTSPTNNRFLLTVDFGSIVLPPGFPGWTPKSVSVITLTAHPSYACSGLPIATVRGRNNVGGTRVFTLYETTRPNYLPGGYVAICRVT